MTDDDAFRSSNNVRFKTDKIGVNWAWLEVNIDTDYIDQVWTINKRLKVPGLTFDPEKSQIVLTNGLDTVVCANVTKKVTRSIFTGKEKVKLKVKSTKKCKANASIVEREVTYDDGFDMRTKNVNYLVVELTTK